MTEASHALFLSYASEDADAALKICTALRAAGIEVWFDQSELRGGDAWDQLIRRQVRQCALFIAIISAHTDARREGYFRREWRLAVERAQDIAEDEPFLIPVAIDATSEASARVPDQFRAVHWTRLQVGQSAEALVDRIRHLLLADSISHDSVNAPSSPLRLSLMGAASVGSTAAQSRRLWTWIIGGVLVLAVGFFSTYRSLQSKHPMPVVQAPTHGNAELVNDKSIAVLPFADMSEKKDQEYFADGMSEELLDLLSRVPELRVIARTSAFSFKGKNDDVRTIAAKLGVAYLIEGSVRKSARTLRITTQLIRAMDGSHIWSQTYDRNAEDIFKVQDEIAAAVVNSLKVSLAHESMPKATGTHNAEAYSLMLLADAKWKRGDSAEDAAKAEDYLRQSLRLDAGNSAAWASLAHLRFLQANVGWLPPGWDEDRTWEDARVAARKSIDLDPMGTRGQAALANILFFHDWDWAAADAQIKQILAAEPNSANAARFAAFTAWIAGDVDEAIDGFRKDSELDPLLDQTWRQLAFLYRISGRFDEAQSAIRRALDVDPAAPGNHLEAGFIQLSIGDLKASLEEIDEEVDEQQRILGHAIIYFQLGRKDEANSELVKYEEKYGAQDAVGVADIYAFRGDDDIAVQWLNRAYDNHEVDLAFVKTDPFLKTLQSHSRFRSLLRKMKLPEKAVVTASTSSLH